MKNDKKYKITKIYNNIIYANKITKNLLIRLYHSIF